MNKINVEVEMRDCSNDTVKAQVYRFLDYVEKHLIIAMADNRHLLKVTGKCVITHMVMPGGGEVYDCHFLFNTKLDTPGQNMTPYAVPLMFEHMTQWQAVRDVTGLLASSYQQHIYRNSQEQHVQQQEPKISKKPIMRLGRKNVDG